MLSVDKGYRKRGIGASLWPSVSAPQLTDTVRLSIRVGAAFHQCHASQWGTGGKGRPLPPTFPTKPL